MRTPEENLYNILGKKLAKEADDHLIEIALKIRDGKDINPEDSDYLIKRLNVLTFRELSYEQRNKDKM